MTDKADETSGSATHEPWKKPGQTSQDPSQQPLPKEKAIEQQKNKKQDK